MTPQDRLDQLHRLYPMADGDWEVGTGEHFALVEAEASADGPVWITTHVAREAATHYHENQPAGDWIAVLLVDLDTGERFEPRVAWVPVEA